jgi:hypothetical protein
MALLEAERGQHGHQREREQQRPGERKDDGERDRRKQLAFEALKREQRQEHQRDDHDARRDRHDHVARRAQHEVEAGRRLPAFPHVTQPLDDILDDDDRAIDEHADGDGKAAQAHQVGGQPEQVHEQERDQRGHGQRGRHDGRRAPVAQEDHQQHDDQHRGFEQGFLDRADRAADQIGAVVERMDRGSGGKRVLQFLDPRLDARDDLCASAPRRAITRPSTTSLPPLRETAP